jgi:hypothetical protein
VRLAVRVGIERLSSSGREVVEAMEVVVKVVVAMPDSTGPVLLSLVETVLPPVIGGDSARGSL